MKTTLPMKIYLPTPCQMSNIPLYSTYNHSEALARLSTTGRLSVYHST